MSYGTSVTLDVPFADAAGRVRAALQEQGFGVLTEIDVTATLRARLGEQIHISFRTTCGREIRIGHLVLGGGRHPAHRVSLDVGASSDGGTGTWAGLTVGEARRLAATLLMQAAACDALPPQA